jgi:hypothetical protein
MTSPPEPVPPVPSNFPCFVLWQYLDDGGACFPTLQTPEGPGFPMFTTRAKALAFQVTHPDGSDFRVVHARPADLVRQLGNLMKRGVRTAV